MYKMIPLCEPYLNGKEWQYVKECLDSNRVSSVGSTVERFEKGLADYLSSGTDHSYYAVACVNGTSALHVALLVAGIGADEEVLVPALTFVAPANAIRYVGAWPTFIDVEPSYWQLDPQKVYDFLKEQCVVQKGALINRNTKRKVSAILPVHILGHPVDMDPLLEIAQRFDLVVIEDAAESLGALYKERKIGTLGHIACFSFNGNKIVTAGGGGMIVTAHPTWAQKARYLTTQAKDDPLEYIHHEIGYNYRLTNIQAAIGVAQLQSLDQHIQAKRKMAALYREKLEAISGLTQPMPASWAHSTFWLYTILVEPGGYGMESRQLHRKLREAHIESRPLWHPIHRLKPFSQCYAHKVEVAFRLYREGLSLPSSVGLCWEDQKRVIDVIVENRLNKK